MDNLVPEAYRRYGLYVNRFRALPLKNDGLKPVERRLLLTAHMIAREKYVKSARVTGTCMAKFHPHSDSYGTLTQLVTQGFVDGQGNWGNNLGVDPSPAAASRYTECKLSGITENIAFRLIKYVPWEESELDDEPIFLPTMFPFCLMGNEITEGIGFGRRTYIPCYNMEDLRDRLMWLLSDRKGTEPIIKPKTECRITAKKEDLQELLTTGKAKITINGVVNVDNVQQKAILRSWPPRMKFQSILNKAPIKKMLDNQDIGFVDSSSGKNGTYIIFTVLKQRNKVKIFKDFVKKLKTAVTGSLSFEIVTVDGEVVDTTSVDDMLMNTFNNFKEVNKEMLKSTIETIGVNIQELLYLETLRGPLSEVLKDIKDLTKDNYDKVIEKLVKLSGVDDDVVRELLRKYRIQKLLTVSTDTSQLSEKLASFEDDLKNLTDYVLNQYK